MNASQKEILEYIQSRSASVKKTKICKDLLNETLKLSDIPDAWRRSYIIFGSDTSQMFFLRRYSLQLSNMDQVRGIKQSTDDLRKELGL